MLYQLNAPPQYCLPPPRARSTVASCTTALNTATQVLSTRCSSPRLNSVNKRTPGGWTVYLCTWCGGAQTKLARSPFTLSRPRTVDGALTNDISQCVCHVLAHTLYPRSPRTFRPFTCFVPLPGTSLWNPDPPVSRMHHFTRGNLERSVPSSVCSALPPASPSGMPAGTRRRCRTFAPGPGARPLPAAAPTRSCPPLD